MKSFCKTVTAAGIGSVAAAILASAPAYAYKVNDKLEVGAKIFANAVSVDGNPTSAEDDAASGFHFDRAYFEARYHADDNNMVRLTLDQKAPDGNVFVKYAYWQHKFANGIKLKAGQNHTPLVDYLQTKLWGHRYVAKTFTDEIGAQTSSDLGVSVLGSIGGNVDYYVSLMNGEGYTHTPNGAGYALMGRVEFHTQGLHVGLFGQSETDRKGEANYDPTRGVIYAWWQNDFIQVGGQYMVADDGDSSRPFDSAQGYNVLTNINLPMGNKTKAFARYDSVDKKDSGDDATLIIVGVESEFAHGIKLALDYQSKDPGTPGTDSVDTIGVHGQFKF